MIGPPDNSWGAEISDNVWNGMVGQLQRKEVDIVATALTVSSQRETVMDFTHPYYYEVSSMIIKKPDSQSGRWRKLLDPFSPTVFLCIGILLPVISFLLFIFEKNNPYYRKIRREKIRGLHHFSDSFWYIYGSLLTHGMIIRNDNMSIYNIKSGPYISWDKQLQSLLVDNKENPFLNGVASSESHILYWFPKTNLKYDFKK